MNAGGSGIMPNAKQRNKICVVAAADQTRGMQDQMTGAAMGMPQDPSKAFKVRFTVSNKALNHQQLVENAVLYIVQIVIRSQV